MTFEHEQIQDLGKLQGKFESLSDRFDALEKKVDEIHVVITKAKGGWLLLILIGGGLSWALQTFLPLLKKVSFQ